MNAKTVGKAAVNLVILGAVVYFGARIIDRVSGKIPV